MEKSPTRRLLDAAYEALAAGGAKGCTVRAVEQGAGLPHGSVRHHFGSRAGLLAALVDDLLRADQEALGESPGELMTRLLGPQRTRTLARYELFLMAARDESLRRRVIEARDELVGAARAMGESPERARALVAAVDGLILDGILRADGGVDPGVFLQGRPT